MIKQRIISLAIAFLLVVCFVPVVKSLSIQTFSTDSTTGWTVSGWDHIGSKTLHILMDLYSPIMVIMKIFQAP